MASIKAGQLQSLLSWYLKVLESHINPESTKLKGISFTHSLSFSLSLLIEVISTMNWLPKGLLNEVFLWSLALLSACLTLASSAAHLAPAGKETHSQSP